MPHIGFFHKRSKDLNSEGWWRQAVSCCNAEQWIVKDKTHCSFIVWALFFVGLRHRPIVRFLTEPVGTENVSLFVLNLALIDSPFDLLWKSLTCTLVSCIFCISSLPTDHRRRYRQSKVSISLASIILLFHNTSAPVWLCLPVLHVSTMKRAN